MLNFKLSSSCMGQSRLPDSESELSKLPSTPPKRVVQNSSLLDPRHVDEGDRGKRREVLRSAGAATSGMSIGRFGGRGRPESDASAGAPASDFDEHRCHGRPSPDAQESWNQLTRRGRPIHELQEYLARSGQSSTHYCTRLGTLLITCGQAGYHPRRCAISQEATAVRHVPGPTSEPTENRSGRCSADGGPMSVGSKGRATSGVSLPSAESR